MTREEWEAKQNSLKKQVKYVPTGNPGEVKVVEDSEEGNQDPGKGLWNKDKKAYVDSVLNANKHLDWVQRLYESNPKAVVLPGEKYPSTHLMGDNGEGYVFPTIVNINGQLIDLGDRAEDYARETNTGIQLPKDQGTWFARSTNDKSGYKMGTGVLKGKPAIQPYKKGHN
jgi:hypothetical protein